MKIFNFKFKITLILILIMDEIIDYYENNQRSLYDYDKNLINGLLSIISDQVEKFNKTRDYKRLQEITRDYKRLQEITTH